MQEAQDLLPAAALFWIRAVKKEEEGEGGTEGEEEKEGGEGGEVEEGDVDEDEDEDDPIMHGIAHWS